MCAWKTQESPNLRTGCNFVCIPQPGHTDQSAEGKRYGLSYLTTICAQITDLPLSYTDKG